MLLAADMVGPSPSSWLRDDPSRRAPGPHVIYPVGLSPARRRGRAAATPPRRDGRLRGMNNTPSVVRTSSVLWLTAIAAGVFETALVVSTSKFSDVAVGLAVRVAVFAVMTWVILRMRAGRDWA